MLCHNGEGKRKKNDNRPLPMLFALQYIAKCANYLLVVGISFNGG